MGCRLAVQGNQAGGERGRHVQMGERLPLYPHIRARTCRPPIDRPTPRYSHLSGIPNTPLHPPLTARAPSPPHQRVTRLPGPAAPEQDAYLSDVYTWYIKHLEDEAPVSDFKYAAKRALASPPALRKRNAAALRNSTSLTASPRLPLLMPPQVCVRLGQRVLASQPAAGAGDRQAHLPPAGGRTFHSAVSRLINQLHVKSMGRPHGAGRGRSASEWSKWRRGRPSCRRHAH